MATKKKTTKKKTTKKASKKKILGYCEKQTQKAEPKKPEKMNLYLVTFKEQYLVYGTENEAKLVVCDPYNRITKMDEHRTIQKISNLKELNKLAEEIDFDDEAYVEFTNYAMMTHGDDVEQKHGGDYIVSTVVDIEKMCD